MAPQQKVCPSCGALQSGETACSVCGFNFNAETEQREEIQNVSASPAETNVAASPSRAGFCPSCGKPVEKGHSFCASCGAALKKGISRPPEISTPKLQPKTMLVAAGVIIIIVGGIAILTTTFRDKTPAPPVAPQETQQMQPPVGEAQKPHAPTEEQLRAIEEFKKQVAENPKDTLAVLHLANSLYDVENFPDAVSYYRQYLAANPKNADVRVDYSYCLSRSGQLDQAITEVKNAIKINPKQQVAYYNLAVYYFEQNNMADGSQWLEKCVEVDSTSKIGQQANSMLSNHAQFLKKNQ